MPNTKDEKFTIKRIVDTKTMTLEEMKELYPDGTEVRFSKKPYLEDAERTSEIGEIYYDSRGYAFLLSNVLNGRSSVECKRGWDYSYLLIGKGNATHLFTFEALDSEIEGELDDVDVRDFKTDDFRITRMRRENEDYTESKDDIVILIKQNTLQLNSIDELEKLKKTLTNASLAYNQHFPE